MWKKLLWVGLLISVPLLALAASSAPPWPPVAWVELQLHRDHFEAVVQQARTLHLRPGQQTQMPHGWAACTPGGGLQVGIITADHGHAGITGFLYSEAPVHENTQLDVPSDLFIVGSPLVARWWIAYNNLQ